jgi:hypothetical protein
VSRRHGAHHISRPGEGTLAHTTICLPLPAWLRIVRGPLSAALYDVISSRVSRRCKGIFGMYAAGQGHRHRTMSRSRPRNKNFHFCFCIDPPPLGSFYFPAIFCQWELSGAFFSLLNLSFPFSLSLCFGHYLSQLSLFSFFCVQLSTNGSPALLSLQTRPAWMPWRSGFAE